MKITYMGHSCFVLEEAGFKLVIDPYDDVPGYPPLQVEAHRIYCSHAHRDHCAMDRVILLDNPPEDPFTVEVFEEFHDRSCGTVYGTTKVQTFCAGGVRVTHLGDLGRWLDVRGTKRVRGTDVLLIPVGGMYTIDGYGAYEQCLRLNFDYGCAVPMHYYEEPYGYTELVDKEEFISQFERYEDSPIVRLEGNSFEVGVGYEHGSIVVPKLIV